MEIEKLAKETILPTRTKYQLEKFVIGQHDTPEMQWKQVLLEAQNLQFNIKQAYLDSELMKLKIAKHLEKNTAEGAIKAEKVRLDLVMAERSIAAAEQEFSWLSEIAENIGYFSVTQIEENQEEYWQKRLTRQAEVDVTSGRTGISAGNLQSMISAQMLDDVKEIK